MADQVVFPRTEASWLFDRDAVRFFALYRGRVINCVISMEALYSHFGANDFTAEESLRAFNEHRSVIEDIARSKIASSDPKPGEYVLLVSEDFPKRGTTTTPPPNTPGLITRASAAIHNDPQLRAWVGEANAILQRDLAHGRKPATAEWDVVDVPGGVKLAKLKLTDPETGAAVDGLFTREDLSNLPFARFSLFRLWDDMLRERGRKQMESLVSAAGTEG
jgi:hypothetical protein